MKDYNNILEKLKASGNLRSLPDVVHRGKWIEKEGQTMLNLSSNDYLGLLVPARLAERVYRTVAGKRPTALLLLFPVTDREFPGLFRTGRIDGRSLRTRSRPAVQ